MIDKTSDYSDECSISPTISLDYSSYLIPTSVPSAIVNMCLTDPTLEQGTSKTTGHSGMDTMAAYKNGQWMDRISSSYRYVTLKPALRSIMITRRCADRGAERGVERGVGRVCDNTNNNAADGDVQQDEEGSDAIALTNGASSVTEGPKKNVTFADHKGLALAVIIEISDLSELNLLLSDTSLAQSAAGSLVESHDDPPLILNFKQPASNYVHFRDRLEKNNVSLENVILKDYTILGTIKVKNIAYDKCVFVRLTYDSWETFVDASACLANGIMVQGTSVPMFETFTFDIVVPSDTNVKKKIEFAVCYDVNSTQYWDNNDGHNYEIISSEWQLHQERLKGMDSVSELRECESWSGFACWDNVDTSMPYW